MKFTINFTLAGLRPSNIVRSIEDGVVGSAELLGRVAKATGESAADFARRVKLESAARRMIKADQEWEGMSFAERTQRTNDEAEIAERAQQILAARRKAS